MDIGHRIAAARMKAGLSQTELAEAVGVTRGLVGQWESHKKKPGREIMGKLAKALTVSMDYLQGSVEISRISVTISDPREVALVRKFRSLGAVQQNNVHQLLDAAVEVGQQVNQKRRPTKVEPSTN